MNPWVRKCEGANTSVRAEGGEGGGDERWVKRVILARPYSVRDNSYGLHGCPYPRAGGFIVHGS
jgi:hypothetical protein